MSKISSRQWTWQLCPSNRKEYSKLYEYSFWNTTTVLVHPLCGMENVIGVNWRGGGAGSAAASPVRTAKAPEALKLGQRSALLQKSAIAKRARFNIEMPVTQVPGVRSAPRWFPFLLRKHQTQHFLGWSDRQSSMAISAE